MPIIKLKSSDNVVFPVDEHIARRFLIINGLLDNLGLEDGSGDQDEPVPLPNVKSATLKKVIEWAIHHQDDPPPSPHEDPTKEKRSDDIDAWDAEFLKVDQETLYDLILAANYLDIKGLLDLTCKFVANSIRGKTAEQVRAKFNLVNDMDDEEVEQVRAESDWDDVEN